MPIGVDDLELHHLYRAMAWLGEELPEAQQAGRTLVPRCVKDAIEETLFARRRDLFTDLSIVFMERPRCISKGAVARRSVSSATARIIGRISIR